MLLLYNSFLKYLVFFMIGGFTYGGIEILFRGYSHISMFVAGGICFVLMGQLYKVAEGRLSLLSQMLISAGLITLVEFITGLVVNVWMKLEVWDYSELSFNVMGQICPLFTVIWFILSPLGIILNGYLRYFILGEEKPEYRLFHGKTRGEQVTGKAPRV